MTYRDYLKNELLERKRQNASYSLRAFAKSLGFSSSQLSEAMSGKANFSRASLKKIATRLKLSAKETDYLCTLGDLEKADAETRETLVKRIERLTKTKFTDLKLDEFKQIADWVHSAILELVHLDGFELTAQNAADKLRIDKLEAELAIERLERLKLFNKTLQIRSEEKSAAMRAFYRQMFEKASTALEEQSPQERYSGYETFAVAQEAMPEVRAACDEFFDEVLRIASRHPKKTDVFHLFIHMFNLTPRGH